MSLFEEILQFHRFLIRKELDRLLTNLNTAIIVGEAGTAGKLALAAFEQLEEARFLASDVKKFDDVLRLFYKIVGCFSTVGDQRLRAFQAVEAWHLAGKPTVIFNLEALRKIANM